MGTSVGVGVCGVGVGVRVDIAGVRISAAGVCVGIWGVSTRAGVSEGIGVSVMTISLVPVNLLFILWIGDLRGRLFVVT